jgi:hypothetical protein
LTIFESVWKRNGIRRGPWADLPYPIYDTSGIGTSSPSISASRNNSIGRLSLPAGGRCNSHAQLRLEVRAIDHLDRIAPAAVGEGARRDDAVAARHQRHSEVDAERLDPDLERQPSPEHRYSLRTGPKTGHTGTLAHRYRFGANRPAGQCEIPSAIPDVAERDQV